LEAAMVTPEDGVVEVFDKETVVISQVRAYDIWTVSGNQA
jgi:hypothetical protein